MNATEFLKMHRDIETEGDKSPVARGVATREHTVSDKELSAMLTAHKVGLAEDISNGRSYAGGFDAQQRVAISKSLRAIAMTCIDAANKLDRYYHDADFIPECIRENT